MSYTFYTDPGHGWLEVPVSELVALGIADKISAYSYRDGAMAYLEADCDLTRFAIAKGWQSIPDSVVSIYQETTPIRNYNRFYI